MPQDNNFWNPYRWVPVSNDPIEHAIPGYHHRWEGLSGKLDCTLEALTPLLIGRSRGDGRFIENGQTRKPFIPGTSLKGLFRSLVELIGNAAIPFPRGEADANHELSQASQGEGPNWRLDIGARMFGHLDRQQVFAGLVRFTDGIFCGEKAPQSTGVKVASGAPDPSHRPFYPAHRRARKFYHHQTGAETLTGPHPGIKESQQRTVYPLPPGARFRFEVAFDNLREAEIGLLLYCLVLEEDVTVTLSAAALGPEQQSSVTLRGPMRHKLGGCKPQGAGSIHIRIDKMQLQTNRANRYRTGSPKLQVLEGEPLVCELRSRTQSIMDRTDDTMQNLRAMMIYDNNDPRAKALNYPSFVWFQEDKGTGAPLKPTL